jgi:hypothetical protein
VHRFIRYPPEIVLDTCKGIGTLYADFPDLPRPVQRVSEAGMSGAQLAQYDAAIEDARKIDKPGAVLEILQRMRAISLHPGGNPTMSHSDFIGASARMRIAFDALDSIASRRERVLVFFGRSRFASSSGGNYPTLICHGRATDDHQRPR